MANPFLNKSDLMERDVETAIMLEQAVVFDIGNAVAYTDGNKVFINTDDNLYKILPAYDHRMLKWLLWHERYHKELRHHNRFFKYLHELDEAETLDEFHVSKEEVNIIMDILVHDSLCKLFPELVEVAVNNLAQMRNRNSLNYTFKTSTLEEMLDEYKQFKHPEEGDSSEGKEGESKEGEGEGKDSKSKESDKKDTPDGETKDAPKKKGHGEGGESDTPRHERAEDGEPEINEDAKRPDASEQGEHDKTDWSKLDSIDSKEFITETESSQIEEAVAKLRRKKFRLAKLTETLNGLVTSVRRRTYSKPSPVRLANGAVLKGSTPGRTQLYIIFDASGSMSGELSLFKEIISKSIPQALEMPCEWFAGHGAKIPAYKTEQYDGYYKGKFKDILPVWATNGFDDDGDRVIELCWQAEQLGYSPIGVTDGGGQISWSADKLKQLKRTVLVGQNPHWLEKAKKINPRIQTLDV